MKPKKTIEVMVIDDEPKERVFIKNSLKITGFRVIWCEDWVEVSRLLSERAHSAKLFPRIALVDMHFSSNPENNHLHLQNREEFEGIAIVQAILNTCKQYGYAQIPCVGYTGKLGYLLKAQMLSAGVIDFVSYEEAKRPDVLSRRLMECIYRDIEGIENLPFPKLSIEELEDDIVDRVLNSHKAESIRRDDLNRNAADILRWELFHVERVRQRLESRGFQYS